MHSETLCDSERIINSGQYRKSDSLFKRGGLTMHCSHHSLLIPVGISQQMSFTIGKTVPNLRVVEVIVNNTISHIGTINHQMGEDKTFGIGTNTVLTMVLLFKLAEGIRISMDMDPPFLSRRILSWQLQKEQLSRLWSWMGICSLV